MAHGTEIQRLWWALRNLAKTVTGDSDPGSGTAGDHTLLSNIGTYTHPQIDSHIDDANSHIDDANQHVNHYNVEEYGATGLGADDTASVQSAIDAAIASGGGIVYLPPGVYGISSTLNISDGVTLQGCGCGEYAGSAPGGVSVLKALNAALDPMVKITGQGGSTYYRMGLRDLQLNGGIFNYVIRDMLQLVDCQLCLIDNVIFYQNTAFANGNATIRIKTSGAGKKSGRNIISNCFIHSPRYVTGAADAECYALYMENDAGSQNVSNSVTGCYFYDPSRSANSRIIYTTDDCGLNIVSNCYIQLQGAVAQNGGVYIGGTGGNDIFTNVTIDGASGFTALEFADGANDCLFIGTVTGNVVDNNSTEDNLATIINANSVDGPQFRALKLIPRSAAPSGASEGNAYYDSDTNEFLGTVDGSTYHSFTPNDTAYDIGWSGDTTHSASKNAIYGKVNELEGEIDLNTTHASGDGSDHADVAQNTSDISSHIADTADPHSTVEDGAYPTGWNGDTNSAVSRNQVFNVVGNIFSALAAYVTKATWTSNHTLVKADTASNPTSFVVAEQSLVGRITGGNITALTATQVRTLLNVEDGADVTDATNVDAAGATMNTDFNAKGDLLSATADDTPAILSVGTDDYVLTADSAESTGLKWAATQKPGLSKSFTIQSPDDDEDWTIFFTNQAITVTEMRCVLRGSSTPSVTWTVRHHATDRSNAGNEVVTSGTTTTSTTSGSDVTSFNDATIEADSFVWFETTNQSGTVDELHLTIYYTED